MTSKPHKKETLYFSLRIAFALLGGYFVLLGTTSFLSAGQSSEGGGQLVVTAITFLLYVLIFILYFRLYHILMVGHLRGNGVQITATQFPEVFAMVQEASATLGIKNPPKVFLVQSGGLLNAFATRFAGKDYVAIYSDVFGTLETEPDVLKFILAHELTHVKRRHIQKRFWTFLSFYVPFLGSAYSRACEHTCDSFAAEIAPGGSRKGLLLLAAGKDLYRRVNVDQYLVTFEENNTGAVKFAGILASHPHLPKRIQYLDEILTTVRPSEK